MKICPRSFRVVGLSVVALTIMSVGLTRQCVLAAPVTYTYTMQVHEDSSGTFLDTPVVSEATLNGTLTIDHVDRDKTIDAFPMATLYLNELGAASQWTLDWGGETLSLVPGDLDLFVVDIAAAFAGEAEQIDVSFGTFDGGGVGEVTTIQRSGNPDTTGILSLTLTETDGYPATSLLDISNYSLHTYPWDDVPAFVTGPPFSLSIGGDDLLADNIVITGLLEEGPIVSEPGSLGVALSAIAACFLVGLLYFRKRLPLVK